MPSNRLMIIQNLFLFSRNKLNVSLKLLSTSCGCVCVCACVLSMGGEMKNSAVATSLFPENSIIILKGRLRVASWKWKLMTQHWSNYLFTFFFQVFDKSHNFLGDGRRQILGDHFVLAGLIVDFGEDIAKRFLARKSVEKKKEKKIRSFIVAPHWT